MTTIAHLEPFDPDELKGHRKFTAETWGQKDYMPLINNNADFPGKLEIKILV